MAIKDAERFIKEIAVNGELRKSIYSFELATERIEYLQSEGYIFSNNDFEESANHLKTECPTEEEAIKIEELRLWWNMLSEGGSEVCAPTKCASCSSACS